MEKKTRLMIEFSSQEAMDNFVARLDIEKDPMEGTGLYKLKAYPADAIDFDGRVPASSKYDWFILRGKGTR